MLLCIWNVIYVLLFLLREFHIESYHHLVTNLWVLLFLGLFFVFFALFVLLLIFCSFLFLMNNLTQYRHSKCYLFDTIVSLIFIKDNFLPCLWWQNSRFVVTGNCNISSCVCQQNQVWTCPKSGINQTWDMFKGILSQIWYFPDPYQVFFAPKPNQTTSTAHGQDENVKLNPKLHHREHAMFQHINGSAPQLRQTRIISSVRMQLLLAFTGSEGQLIVILSRPRFTVTGWK